MNIVLVLSGGTGSRMQLSIPKQYFKVSGRPLISYCFDGLSESHSVNSVYIVADAAWHNMLYKLMEEQGMLDRFGGFAEPGLNRQLSIYNGLRLINETADKSSMIMIHDAARPYLTAQMIDTYFEASIGRDGVLPCLPMKDTIYHSFDGNNVTGLLNRSELFAGQAPEIYKLDKYLAANEALLPDSILQINGAAEPAIIAGMDIAIVPGEERNFKITTMDDLERFEKCYEGMGFGRNK